MLFISFICRWENLEAGAKDASDFLKWQTEMRQQDLEDELAEIERRRLQGKLSHEEAILARQDLIQENKQKVKSMKEEVSPVCYRIKEIKFWKSLINNCYPDMSWHANVYIADRENDAGFSSKEI